MKLNGEAKRTENNSQTCTLYYLLNKQAYLLDNVLVGSEKLSTIERILLDKKLNLVLAKAMYSYIRECNALSPFLYIHVLWSFNGSRLPRALEKKHSKVSKTSDPVSILHYRKGSGKPGCIMSHLSSSHQSSTVLYTLPHTLR